MGLFSTVLHIYQKSQVEVINAVANELRQSYGINKIDRLDSKAGAFQQILGSELEKGVAYLVTQKHGNWTTVVEIAVSLAKSFYLNELANGISEQLGTYVLSFHLHDGDVFYYNLEKNGLSLDGYNSDYQYFLNEPAEHNDIISQRHSPQAFAAILPSTKNWDALNVLLNEGYWKAFDDGVLDEHGIPPEEYFVDEENRFERVGKYLEIFSSSEYPFANWYHHKARLDLDNCYLLIGVRN